MKFVQILGLVAVSFAMAACGSKNESSVNGMSAGDYYNQFVTEKSTPSCNGQSHTENTANGEIGGQSITLKLLTDKTFQITSSWSSNEIWSGSWSVDKTELVLNGVSRATGVIYNKLTALSFDFSDSTAVPVLLRGQKGVLIRNTSTYQCTRE